MQLNRNSIEKAVDGIWRILQISTLILQITNHSKEVAKEAFYNLLTDTYVTDLRRSSSCTKYLGGV
jgi:hypothetical protein